MTKMVVLHCSQSGDSLENSTLALDPVAFVLPSARMTVDSPSDDVRVDCRLS